jgi:hypothetical protein
MNSCLRCSRHKDDVAENGEDDSVFEIRQQSWKLMADVGDYHPACAGAGRTV